MKKRTPNKNTGWTNGGIVGLDLDNTLDDPNDPSPRLHGVAAFIGLEPFGAIPELAWLFSASACELGFTSSWDGLIAIAMIGGGEKKHGDAASTMGPPDHATRAAGLQRRILGRLSQLTPRLQSVIEVAYTDRRYQTPDVSKYGCGIVAIVKRGHYVKAAFQRSPLGHELALLQALLMGFSGHGGDAPPDWSAFDVRQWGGENLERRETNAAQYLLDEAHSAYRLTMTPSDRNRRKRRKAPKAKRGAMVFVAEATTGAGKRRLIPVPRAVSCNP